MISTVFEIDAKRLAMLEQGGNGVAMLGIGLILARL